MTEPTPAFRAPFAAGAARGADTTSRPDRDTAVQQAWEQHGAGDERGRELADDIAVVERALRHADLSTREVEAARAVLCAARVDSPTVRANYGPGEERLRADLRRHGVAQCVFASVAELEPHEVGEDDAAEVAGILAVAQWMQAERLADALGLDVDSVVASGDIDVAIADRIAALAAPPETEAGGDYCRRLTRPDGWQFPLTSTDDMTCGTYGCGDDVENDHMDEIDRDDLARLAATPPAPEGEAGDGDPSTVSDQDAGRMVSTLCALLGVDPTCLVQTVRDELAASPPAPGEGQGAAEGDVALVDAADELAGAIDEHLGEEGALTGALRDLPDDGAEWNAVGHLHALRVLVGERIEPFLAVEVGDAARWSPPAPAGPQAEDACATCPTCRNRHADLDAEQEQWHHLHCGPDCPGHWAHESNPNPVHCEPLGGAE